MQRRIVLCKMLFQTEIPRLIIIYVFFGILSLYCLVIAYKVLVRKSQRLNFFASCFYLSLSIGFFINMIYTPMREHNFKLILNFVTTFIICFSAVFLVIVNLIILKTNHLNSIKAQNRYILFYGILLLGGMSILYLLGIKFDSKNSPFFGVQIVNGRAKWGIVFLIYYDAIMTFFAIIPINYTNFKVFLNLETDILRKKWFYYLVGFIGLSGIFYILSLYNFLDSKIYSIFGSISSMSLIIWGHMMYYGIGIEVKNNSINIKKSLN